MEKIKDWEIVDWICATVAVLWCVSVATVAALWCVSVATVVIMELIG